MSRRLVSVALVGWLGGCSVPMAPAPRPSPGPCPSDPNLPAEPTIPGACTSLPATQSITAGTLPDEADLDTARIQAALDACPAGQAVRLAPEGARTAFITAPLLLPSGVSLWIDAGATLYASRDPSRYGASCGTSSGSCPALITASGAGSGVVGEGVIDGQGGEWMIGQDQSWWDRSASLAATGGAVEPTLIRASGATDFTLYRITLHDAPKFHVQLDAAGFVVWGITIQTPSTPTNSQGTALTPRTARNTDGIDPGEAASDGFIVCSLISDGDDQIAIKGGTAVDRLTIAHDYFGAGQGMSIGSETNGGVSNIEVYDLTIDGTGSDLTGGDSNGIRIKSNSSRGGSVDRVTYRDVCTRNIANPIVVTPFYKGGTGSLIPDYTGIAIRDVHAVGDMVTPAVTLEGYDASHVLGVTLDNVTVDGLAAVTASFADVSVGPGSVSFTPSGDGVRVVSEVTQTDRPDPCTTNWVAL